MVAGHRRPERCSATIDEATPLVVGVFMAVLGLGLGATMQNLVLAVQNNTAQSDMGAASSWSRSSARMGGSIGVSALGAVLSHQVADKVAEGLAALGDATGRRHREPLDPRPRLAARPGPGDLRAGLRRGHRPHLPGGGAVRGGWRCSACCSSARCRCAPRSCGPTRSRRPRPRSRTRSSRARAMTARRPRSRRGSSMRSASWCGGSAGSSRTGRGPCTSTWHRRRT